MKKRPKLIIFMPSGEYKGCKIQFVPTEHLERLLEKPSLNDRLHFHIKQELLSRAARLSNPFKVHIE